MLQRLEAVEQSTGCGALRYRDGERNVTMTLLVAERRVCLAACPETGGLLTWFDRNCPESATLMRAVVARTANTGSIGGAMADLDPESFSKVRASLRRAFARTLQSIAASSIPGEMAPARSRGNYPIALCFSPVELYLEAQNLTLTASTDSAAQLWNEMRDVGRFAIFATRSVENESVPLFVRTEREIPTIRELRQLATAADSLLSPTPSGASHWKQLIIGASTASHVVVAGREIVAWFGSVHRKDRDRLLARAREILAEGQD